MTMNPQQARMIDPVLTNVVRGYKNHELIGKRLFPVVPVSQSGGQIVEFGKEAFKRYNTRRAPGANTKRVQFGHLGKPFALHHERLEGQVPYEIMNDAAKVPGINLKTRATNGVMQIMELELEFQQSILARDPNQYDADHKVDLTGAKWTDGANDPLDDIDLAKEAISDSIGMEPNILTLSKAAFKAARRNAKVRENFKYTTSKSVTVEMLAEYFDVEEIVVGKAISFDDNESPTQLWGTDAILAYVAKTPTGQEQPSFSYTYELENTPIAEVAYSDRNANSWIVPVSTARAPVIAGSTAGYLLRNVG